MLNKNVFGVNKDSKLKMFIFNNNMIDVVVTSHKLPLFLARDVARSVHHPTAQLATLLMDCNTVHIRKTDYECTPLAKLWHGYDSAPKCLITLQDAETLVSRLNKFEVRPFKRFLLKVVIPKIFFPKKDGDNDSDHSHRGVKSAFSDVDRNEINNELFQMHQFAKHIAREAYRLSGMLNDYYHSYR